MTEQSVYTRGAREGQCRSCNAHVWWTKGPDHTDQILDLEPVAKGNIVFTGMGKIRYVTKADPAPYGAIRYQSHFVTCPNRDKHRKNPRPEPAQADLFSTEGMEAPLESVAIRKYR